MIQAFLKWWKGDSLTPGVANNHWLYEVVNQAWQGGFTVSSDLARCRAVYVAMAATLGLITTREADGSWGRTWYVTPSGIRFIHNYWENK